MEGISKLKIFWIICFVKTKKNRIMSIRNSFYWQRLN